MFFISFVFKSCRVNFGYSDLVCDNMIDKTINNIDCVNVKSLIDKANLTLREIINMKSHNVTNVTDLEVKVCQAEIDSQHLETALNLYLSPIGK